MIDFFLAFVITLSVVTLALFQWDHIEWFVMDLDSQNIFVDKLEDFVWFVGEKLDPIRERYTLTQAIEEAIPVILAAAGFSAIIASLITC